jgi:uncharacterized membrane protein YjgN (DUF898 family)
MNSETIESNIQSSSPVITDVPAAATLGPAAPIPMQPQRYALSFTGTGSEYFKIWIVNLLLIFVTLGIYYPWAKVRKAKYLHRNMMLDGAAFDYHANGGTILKGTIIAAALYGIYHLVDSSRSWIIFTAFTVAMCVALPWLLWKSLRFKLSVTSYRALPFSFKASLKESYAVFIPIILYNAAILAVFFYLANQKVANAKLPELQLQAIVYAFLVFALMIVLFYPLFYYWLKRYQHNNYQWTSLRTQLSSSIAGIYQQWLLIAVPFVAFYGGIGLAAYALVGNSAGLLGKMGGVGFAIIAVIFILVYAVTLFVPVIFKALFVSRFQNLVWNATSAQGIRFLSQLTARSLIWQSVKNLFFIAITFGFYWPFAFINIVKLRAASISLVTAAPIMHLAAQHAAADKERNAVGDAAGDLFDIDIAL